VQQAPAGFLFLGLFVVARAAKPAFVTASSQELRNMSLTANTPQNATIDFAKSGGLVPAIIQDHRSGEVLMLGFMNAQALAETQRSGEVTFFSRSRNKLWKKGKSSGHLLKLRELLIDCDADALLLRVEPLGPGVCHEGYRSCFFRRLEGAPNDSATNPNADANPSAFTATIIAKKSFDPSAVYSSSQEQK
jgi:phosphoribosyl-AMP cyclohydrolase